MRAAEVASNLLSASLLLVNAGCGGDGAAPVDMRSPCADVPFIDGGAPIACVDKGFRWLEPGSMPTGLHRVLSFGSNEAWATGNGVVLRWDGQAWRQMSAPLSPDGELLWGSEADDVWISARRGYEPEVLRWDGGAFQILDLRGVGRGSVTLEGLAGTRENFWLAAWGSDQDPGMRIVRRGCGGWSEGPASPAGFMDDLVVPTEDTAFAIFGSNGVFHWNGAKWTRVEDEGFLRLESEPEVSFWQLWSEDGKDLWAVGTDRAKAPGSIAGVYRGSAAGLKPFRRWPEGAAPASIAGEPTALRVVGGPGRVEVWDGKRWTEEATDTQEWLTWVSDPWVVTAEGRLLRRTGKTWQVATGWSQFVAPNWKAGWAASPTEAWVAGEGASRWDGQKWTAVPALAGVTLTSVWGRNGKEVWFGGKRVFRWDGSVVKEVVDPLLRPRAKEGIRGMWGPARGTDVWLIDSDELYHWNGQKMVLETPIGFGGFLAIGGTGSGDLWLLGSGVGNGRVILRRVAGAWSSSPVAIGNFGTVAGLVVLNANDVWAGAAETLHWNGRQWTRSERPRDIVPLLGFSASDVWARGWDELGRPTELWHFDGKEWHCVRDAPYVTAVFGSGPNDVWLATAGGKFLHKGP